MREGLDRHDAIHAIGSVLTGIILMRAKLKAIKMELRKRMHDPIATTGLG